MSNPEYFGINVDKKGNIIKLDIADINLESLPDISSLKKLKSLYLYLNPLKHLPNLDELKELETLNCNGCSLLDIPDLSKLKKLQILHLNDNSL